MPISLKSMEVGVNESDPEQLSLDAKAVEGICRVPMDFDI